MSDPKGHPPADLPESSEPSLSSGGVPPEPSAEWRPEAPEAWGKEPEVREEWHPEDSDSWERARWERQARFVRDRVEREAAYRRRRSGSRSRSHGSRRSGSSRRSSESGRSGSSSDSSTSSSRSSSRTGTRDTTRRPGHGSVHGGGNGSRRGHGRSRSRRTRQLGRRRHPVRRWILIVAGLGVLGAGAILASAYWQVHEIADPLEGIRTNLAGARRDLATGKLPEGDPFTAAVRIADQATQSVDDANWTFRVVGRLPLLGRPVNAIRQETKAAAQWAQAAIVVRDMVVDMLGDKALRGRGEPPPEAEKHGGAPVFHDGIVDVKLIASLTPRLQELIGHLQAAQAAIAQIKPVPLYGRLTEARDHGLEETRTDIALARNAMAGAAVLPTFLGADGPKTYFLALQNNSDLRGTGGAVLAYAFLRIDHGKLDLISSGPIGDIDDKGGGIHAKLPPAVSYYIKLAGVNPRLANGANYSPNLPVVAEAWSSMIAKRLGIHVDGAITLDPVALSYALGNRGVRLKSFDPPITVTAENAVQVIEHDQYTLPPDPRHAFAGDLIKKTWKVLRDPRPFVGTLQKLGKGLREKHIQIWSTDQKTQDLLANLRWNGAMSANPGDYVYLVDNKRIANKVDYYSHQKITYRVTVQPSGAIISSYEVALTNDTPRDDPPEIAGRGEPFGANLAQMSLYVPKRATFKGVDPEELITEDVDPKGFDQHVEGRFRVFTKIMDVRPQSTGTLRYTYSLPDVIDMTPAGKVYQLTLQHQPLVNEADVTVIVRLPKGTTVKSAQGWQVDGSVATFHVTLAEDLVTRIVF